MPIDRDVMIPARDGIGLATDIYTPDGDGPWPVLMERTPYGKHLASRSEVTLADPDRAMTRAEFVQPFTDSGYAVVLQDKRGRYGSEGRYRKYLGDAEDGYDTCAWLVEQPWCNGKIGTFGLSYCAHTQAALASLNAPGLAAMWLDCGMLSPGRSLFPGRQGCPENHAFTCPVCRSTQYSVATAARRSLLKTRITMFTCTGCVWRRSAMTVTCMPMY